MDVIQKLFDPYSKIDLDGYAVIEGSTESERPTTLGAFQLRARRLASAIEKSCAPSERIAILLPQSADAYAAEIAAFYCGRSFSPLETSHPTDRIAYCIGDLSPKLLITDRAGLDRTRNLGIHTILADEIEEAPSASPTYSDTAYIIYTSGSTGRPKGVCVSRRSMNKFLEWSWRFYAVGPGERWAQFSSLGFDLSLVDLLTCIPSGGTLVPVQSRLDRMLPARFIERNRISIWHSVPSIIPLLLNDGSDTRQQLKTLRVASFCGEPLYPQQVSTLLSQTPLLKILNTYGPTEGTFFCSAQIVDAALCASIAGGSLPIGDPIPGWQFRFSPRNGTTLRELVIASDYLSDGYISETPDADKFGVDESGTRTYRTGDLVRQDAGRTFFVQRADNQVKVRGNRLDLTEVDFHALQAGVVEAKAFVQNGAVFLAVDPGRVSRSDLQSALENNLPRYAVPAGIFEMTPLPRNANAKIDTLALQRIAAKKWGLPDGEQ